MKISIVATGNKMPEWVELASNDFIRRMPREISINSILLPLVKRGKNPDISRIVRDESRKLLGAVPENSLLVALEVTGKNVSTMQFAAVLESWIQQGQDVAIVIGGPDGVSRELLQQAQVKLSLSALTFPHTLVRVILLEQIYRAWSILKNHPYHRA